MPASHGYTQRVGGHPASGLASASRLLFDVSDDAGLPTDGVIDCSGSPDVRMTFGDDSNETDGQTDKIISYHMNTRDSRVNQQLHMKTDRKGQR
ncbi:hypothetical protein BaRGS_00036779 [Batillaria attramentaria]|uniref:Uncharacterized protein n=1 Tax=Batillaria attramentaria TaxID=370345 RepID=A0ABD0JAW7_9CAEN